MSGTENGEPAEQRETRGPAANLKTGRHPLLGSAEHAVWRASYLHDAIPSALLDSGLNIIDANDSFRRLYGEASAHGQSLTQFFAPSFDASKSAELLRSVLSPREGFRWKGRVEKVGREQLLTIAKVWVLPLRPAAAPAGSPGPSGHPPGEALPPGAFSALCLDMTAEYQGLLQNTFSSLLDAARLKDNDTGNHIERVNRYARTLAEHLLGAPEYPEVNRQYVESIGQVAALHDVGKIGTPDDILNKAGPLEPWEWKMMMEHTTNGAFILRKYPNPMAPEIALRHHEKWNGSGYPHGLSGASIPLSARIVALADVYDALRMRRSYKKAFTHEKALETMRGERGTHFDPAVLDRFLEMARECDRIFSELQDPP